MTTSSPPTPDPFPWDDDGAITPDPADPEHTVEGQTRLESGHGVPGFRGGKIPPGPRPPRVADLIRSDAVIDLNAAGALLDRLRDPSTLVTTVAGIRDTLLSVVRERADKRKRARDYLDGNPPTTTDLRKEAVGAADDAAALEALAGAFTVAAREAKGIAGDLLDELPGRGGRPRASFKVADGQGFELFVRREARRELSVDVDALVDVLAANVAATAVVRNFDPQPFVAGVREGIAAFRDVLASSPTFRSTALDSLATRLEDAGEDDLAKRLRAAYARVEVGEPSVKLERKPLS